MDEERGWPQGPRDQDEGRTDPDRPTGLTRRELRALREAEAAAAAEAGADAGDEGRDAAVPGPAAPADDPDITQRIPLHDLPGDLSTTSHAPVDDEPADDRPVDDERADDERADDGLPDDELPGDEPVDDRPVGDGAVSPEGGDPNATVELPRELPPEPDVDDVRWDAPLPSVGVRVPIAERTGAAQAQPAGPQPDGADESVLERGRWPRGVPVAGVGMSPFPMISEAELDPGPGAVHAPRDEAVPAAPDDADVRPGGFPIGGAPSAGAAPGPPAEPLPTLDDLLARRPEPPSGPAEMGWQATVRRITGGLVAPGPGREEQDHRRAVATVQRSLAGPKTVVVINPKGGAHKTTATMLIAATFGMHRGGYTLAWDNNETRGTLGWRSQQAKHHNTAVNLLQDLDRFSDAGAARVGDLDNYVRSQRSARFDVLASDEDAASAASIDAFAFRALHRTLSRFYRIMVVDTGNNMRASNWQAAVEAADQVVIVSTVREDTAQSAAWAVDALRATGHEDVVRRAVTVLSAPAQRRDDELAQRLHEHFGRLTRTVLDVPYDPALVAGTPIDYDGLSRQTTEAWLRVTAAVAEGL